MARRRRMPFKACKKCKALVEHEVEKCPLCSSTLFSDDWEGMVIILTVNSQSASVLKAVKPWRYAIKVR